MVCNRCIMVVKHELEKMQIHPMEVQLGEALLEEEITPMLRDELGLRLKVIGFELIDDARSRLCERIETAIVQLIHHSDTPLEVNYSDFLAGHLNGGAGRDICVARY